MIIGSGISELKMVDSIYFLFLFLFLFYFLFIFLILNLGLEVSMMLHVIVT